MVEIDTLVQTKTAEKKNIPAAHNHIAYIRDSPLGGAKNALKIMSLAAYASETNNCLSVFCQVVGSQQTVIFLKDFNLDATNKLIEQCLCNVIIL